MRPIFFSEIVACAVAPSWPTKREDSGHPCSFSPAEVCWFQHAAGSRRAAAAQKRKTRLTSNVEPQLPAIHLTEAEFCNGSGTPIGSSLELPLTRVGRRTVAALSMPVLNGKVLEVQRPAVPRTVQRLVLVVAVLKAPKLSGSTQPEAVRISETFLATTKWLCTIFSCLKLSSI